MIDAAVSTSLYQSQIATDGANREEMRSVSALKGRQYVRTRITRTFSRHSQISSSQTEFSETGQLPYLAGSLSKTLPTHPWQTSTKDTHRLQHHSERLGTPDRQPTSQCHQSQFPDIVPDATVRRTDSPWEEFPTHTSLPGDGEQEVSCSQASRRILLSSRSFQSRRNGNRQVLSVSRVTRRKDTHSQNLFWKTNPCIDARNFSQINYLAISGDIIDVADNHCLWLELRSTNLRLVRSLLGRCRFHIQQRTRSSQIYSLQDQQAAAYSDAPHCSVLSPEAEVSQQYRCCLSSVSQDQFLFDLQELEKAVVCSWFAFGLPPRRFSQNSQHTLRDRSRRFGQMDSWSLTQRSECQKLLRPNTQGVQSDSATQAAEGIQGNSQLQLNRALLSIADGLRTMLRHPLGKCRVGVFSCPV